MSARLRLQRVGVHEQRGRRQVADVHPKHPFQIGVAEPAFRVEAVAQCDERVEPRVGGPQVGGGAGVQLAPVRPPVEIAHDGLDRPEVGLVRLAAVHVDGEVGAVAAGRGRQRDVVGRGHPHLDRERHGLPVPLNDAAQPGEGGRQRRPRHGVLHLQEPHPARAGEDPVGPVDVLGGGEPARGDTVESTARGAASRRRAGTRGRRRRCRSARRPSTRPPGRAPAPRLGGVVALGGGDVGVREPVELDVVVVAVESSRAPSRGRAASTACSAERGHGLKGHDDEHPERAEAHPCGREDVGVLARRAAADGAVGGDELQRAHLVGEPAGVGRPCRACRWRWRPRRSARRCRRGWATPSRAPTAAG